MLRKIFYFSRMVRSEYNRFQFGIMVAVGAGCLGGTFFLLLKHSSEAEAGVGAFLLLLLGIGMLIGLFSKTPRFFFDEEGITANTLFGRKVYLWNDVTDVFLTTQEWYSVAFIFGSKMEAMKLDFQDGSALCIWGDMYRNMNELRSFVVQKLNARLRFLSNPTTRRAADLFFQKKYAGNPFLSLRALLLSGMFILFLVSLKIKAGREAFLVVPVVFLAVWYGAFGIQMHYFEIADGKLFIRNHFFPWTKKEYALADIEEVAKESPYQKADGLRILTYDFKSKLYCAGSLRKRHWAALLNDLSGFGIKVPDKKF